jgi:hypothetical protein
MDISTPDSRVQLGHAPLVSDIELGSFLNQLRDGVVVMAIAGVVLLIKAFEQSISRGLAYALVPFVSLIFVALYWHDTKKPFFYLLGGFAALAVGIMLGKGPEVNYVIVE